MVEIECPNCHARYQVPAEALGAAGRDVTCSSCGNIWRARPVPAAPPPEALQATAETQAPQRREKMAEIRQMLDQVQAGEAARATAAPVQTRWGTKGEVDDPDSKREAVHRAVFGAEEEDDDDIDRAESFLRGRNKLSGQSGRIESTRRGGKTVDEATSRRKLMHSHARRTRRYDAEKKRASGGGRTGFVLIALVAGTLFGLYTLHERIIQRLPETEPALRDYVAAVDQMRLSLQSQIGALQQDGDG